MENEVNQTPAAPPAPPTGKTVEELQAELESLKKESEGRLRDLQNERAKRQEAESRINVTPIAPPPAEVEVPQDELRKVLSPYIDPLVKEVQAAKAFVHQTLEEKAFSHLSAKTGKSKDQIMADRDFQNRMIAIVQRYGLQGNVYDVTTKAYDIMELENLRVRETERQRAESATANTSVPAGSPVPSSASSVKRWGPQSWAEMSTAEYADLEAKGTFTKDKNTGEIVFTPR